MSRPLVIFTALALGLGGCVSSQTPVSQASVATTNAMTASSTAEFVSMAGSSNLLEIESSRLALRQGESRRVRDFANRMIKDHTQAGRRMDAVLRRAGAGRVAPALTARHQAMLDQLAATPAESFDGAYLALQAQAHEEAVALFSTYAQSGDDPRIVVFARQTLPTLQMHAQQVGRIGGARS